MTEVNELPTNWGRWGDDDEIGTLNLVDDAARARGVAAANLGRTVSIARVSRSGAVVPGPGANLGVHAVDGLMHTPMFTGNPSVALGESLTMCIHHPRLTHLDALSHAITSDGKFYPGKEMSEVCGPLWLTRGGTDFIAGGLVTRGIFLDLAPGSRVEPGHGITAAELDQACERAGVRPEPGDALVVRFGVAEGERGSEPGPGMTLEAVRWMHQHDIALYAGDTGDAHPPIEAGLRSPLHTVGLARMGLMLIDAADPTELAEVCSELGRAYFELVIAPPRIPGLTGLPVNPLAIF